MYYVVMPLVGNVKLDFSCRIIVLLTKEPLITRLVI